MDLTTDITNLLAEVAPMIHSEATLICRVEVVLDIGYKVEIIRILEGEIEMRTLFIISVDTREVGVCLLLGDDIDTEVIASKESV